MARSRASSAPAAGAATGYKIGEAARKLGMSTHALRAWERRYGLVAPRRTAGEARRYSDADLERLALVKRLSESGYALADTAQLSTEALREVLKRLEAYGARSR